jgi:hypothetical protein
VTEGGGPWVLQGVAHRLAGDFRTGLGYEQAYRPKSSRTTAVTPLERGWRPAVPGEPGRAFSGLLSEQQGGKTDNSRSPTGGSHADSRILLQAVAPRRQHMPRYLAAQHNRVSRLVLGQPA